eukprot:1138915-Pelagomonas_calceolata.AAC.1
MVRQSLRSIGWGARVLGAGCLNNCLIQASREAFMAGKSDLDRELSYARRQVSASKTLYSANTHHQPGSTYDCHAFMSRSAWMDG